MTQFSIPDGCYLTQPTEKVAEGEIQIDGSSGETDNRVMTFVIALFRAALGDDHDSTGTLEFSSISLKQIVPLEGRIYGQAYIERRGITVHFLRVRLFDEQGEAVLSGMATCHVSSS